MKDYMHLYTLFLQNVGFQHSQQFKPKNIDQRGKETCVFMSTKVT